jgi:purine-binding chemotaxis protein CheW
MVSPRKVLFVRAGDEVCALPVGAVVETLRPLALTPLPGLPEYVMGLAVVRGAAVPVVALSRLLGIARPPDPARWVTVEVGGRSLALAVDAVLGVDTVAEATLAEVPPVLGEVAREVVERLGVADERLVAFLEAARILPDDVWRELEPCLESCNGS